MEKNITWPEIVFGTNDPKKSKAISRAVKAGILQKLAPRLYSTNWSDSPDVIIKKHRYLIISHLFPGAVISHRSALEGGVSDGEIMLTYKYAKKVHLPGLTIRLFEGHGTDPEDMPFLENIYISSQGRAYLENMQKSRSRGTGTRTLSLNAIELRLDRFIRIYGENEINALRDQAKRVSERLGMQDEFLRLDKMIGALLGTQTEVNLLTESAKYRSKGLPFDSHRIDILATLSAYLIHADLAELPTLVKTKQAKANQAFFESYFSNFIEGTKFEIEEAEKIIFENKIFPHRKADSHDILSTFQIVSDEKNMRSTPQTADQFLTLLQERHAILMQARDDILPGKFKHITNRVGNLVFVQPEEVRGTLIKGFELYRKLKTGIAKAIFVMFLIAEVHPFIDGNGRIARIFMNAELQNADLSRIIIPTVYREDYLLSIRKLSLQVIPQPYVKMLLTAQVFTDSIAFDDYRQALLQFQTAQAFLEPNEGKLIL